MFFPQTTIGTIFLAILGHSKMAIMAIFHHFGRYGLTKYGHKYGSYWYLWREHEKCGSQVKTELKKMRQVKSYGQIKFNPEIIAVSFVFWPYIGPNLKLKVATFLMLYFFTSLSVWIQNG